MLYQDTHPNNIDMFGVPIAPEDDSWANEDAASPVGEQPDAGAATTQPQEPRNNDDVRYQYWQSQHDQLKSKYEQLEAQNQQMMQHLAQLEQPQPQQPEEEAFPEPPAPPQKPYSFSQQDAMSDPNSESARYMVAMSEYNSTMNQYNLYKNQWLEAKQKEQMQQLYQQQQQRDLEATRKADVSTQINQVIAMVQQKYGVDYNTAMDFVNTMSDNSSITVDNLFELYKMRKGGSAEQARLPNGRYAPRPEPNKNYNPFGASVPSQDFQQFQRAQSIPPSMGVHTAQGAQNEDPMITMMKETIAQSNRNTVF